MNFSHFNRPDDSHAEKKLVVIWHLVDLVISATLHRS